MEEGSSGDGEADEGAGDEHNGKHPAGVLVARGPSKDVINSYPCGEGYEHIAF